MYLNCHTGLSFKYGMLPIKTLFDEAKRCGIHKLALTEINNVGSYLEMLRICDENRAVGMENIASQLDGYLPDLEPTPEIGPPSDVRLPRNGLTRFGKAAYHLDIAVGIEFRTKKENE